MLTVSNAMSLLVTCIENVFEWARLIFVRFDAWGWILGGLGVFTVYRFLLKPFLGGSVSLGDSGNYKTRQNQSKQSKKESSEENG